MKRKEIILMARDLMSKHPELSLWHFSFNNRKKSFGLCCYTTRTISISSYLCDSMTDIAIKDTLIHEIAHALTQGHHHDYVWRRKCAELGGVPERTSSISKSLIDGAILQSKYTLTCPCCGYKIPKYREIKHSISCGICYPNSYNEKFKMILTKNY
jgi:predicted SprT family Zn-dependent metalloprotease